jgi:hypothetical protein
MAAAGIRTMLAECLRGQAAWREGKAAEYPDDRRNAASADALRRLAEHVEALPEGDANLAVLSALHEPYHLDVFSPGEEASYMLGRFGFDGAPGDFDHFLGQLVEAEAGDSVEREHEDGEVA